MWHTDGIKAVAGTAFIVATIALGTSPRAFADGYGYGAASPGNIALARKCESLPQQDAMHSKACIALGQSNPELFSPAYRSRMNIAENSAPANSAPPPRPSRCTDADRAHGRNGC